ncbi:MULTISPECIES: metallophosphoesterase [unclassified Spirosoma]|uniref:metallophosphoesterase n=1 Tax=unclassified Spirosoma TaxID=2621999 RepID=UPI00095987E4|nr:MULTISPECIES: metallophosphoesterase [unclassified Spirosoma]MBN8826269.1 metallophosphoesterase [Spirosoma sp.]OJW75173.1 MAG: metallophosphoesterase [Spirosoma sp. 48-14]
MKLLRLIQLAFVLGLCQQVSAQTPTISRGPYLQVVTPTSVVVRWRTDTPSIGRVWFGQSASQLTGDLQESQPTQEHSLTITGLQPATRYTYAIGYGDTQLASGPDYSFKTALPAGDKRPFRMWVLGDFGSGSDNQQAVYQAYRKATANRPADLWLWLGDNAYSYGLESEYQQLVFPVYASTLRNTPIFITPGNHDYADSETNFNIAYYNLFSFPQQGEAGGIPSGSKSYYAANYGNVHLISLDSQGRQDGQYRLYDTTSAQVQWLKRDLAANKLPWTIVIFHHPPYSKGGHNSDTEESMRLIRENLTPILERFGVDLVMNGHSHGYERTYRLKGLRGLANTFDKGNHLADNNTGRYDGSPNSCPILSKGQGTVYVVNGSGGQLGGQSPGFPHPATVYNNVAQGGSMILDVNDDRLDAQFLLSDGSIGDRFTLVKNSGTTTSLTAEYGDTLQFSASWNGDYRWTGGQNSRSISYVADKAGSFPITVKDNQNCLTDQFTVNVLPPPKVTTQASVATTVCVGSTFTVTATPENTTKAAGWQYDVLLSDASGNFSANQVVGSGAINALRATLPTTLSPGTGYRVQVRPRGIPYAQLSPSNAFAVKPLPTATIAGSTTVLKGESVALTINLTGDGPWKGSLSDGTTFSANATPITLTIQPTQSTAYSIASVENSCGKGTSSGQASITVLLPLAEETLSDSQLKVYPNPAHDVLHVELTMGQKKEINVTLVDANGRSVLQKQFVPTSTLSESLPMPHAHGTYLLKVQVGEITLTRKVVRQ